MNTDITVEKLTNSFKEKISELQDEPEFQWKREAVKYALDEKGEPCVKLAIGNVPLGYDLWEGLRNPALVGLYPVGLPEIWEFYANRRKTGLDESGRKTIFQIPHSYDFARKNYTRALIVSVMLPFSPQTTENYAQFFLKEKKGSSHIFARMYEDVNLIIDKATMRTAANLVARDRMVVGMDNNTVEAISKEAVPSTRQGTSHGPCKSGNYSQKSIAVLMGLGQFGISRLFFRDEIINGQVERFSGPLRSIVIFDKEKLIKDGSDGVIYPGHAWREFLFDLSDFTNITAQINKYRFCPYASHDGKLCRKCIDLCPSGAVANSAPDPSRAYPERILKQAYRFWEDKLQFDFDQCCEERGQMGTLFPEWSCAKCMAICLKAGGRRSNATRDFYQKTRQLTKKV